MLLYGFGERSNSTTAFSTPASSATFSISTKSKITFTTALNTGKPSVFL